MAEDTLLLGVAELCITKEAIVSLDMFVYNEQCFTTDCFFFFCCPTFDLRDHMILFILPESSKLPAG